MNTKLNENTQKTIKNLHFGDLIEIDWLDASEATGRQESGKFDSYAPATPFTTTSSQ
jgi:hypothetical protein